MPTSLFFSHNEALVPPYRVIVDTNFINLSLENRVDIVKSMMDVLYAKGSSTCALFAPKRLATDSITHTAAIPCISDCVLAELEKLGHQYRLALRSVRLSLEQTSSSTTDELPSLRPCRPRPAPSPCSSAPAPPRTASRAIRASSASPARTRARTPTTASSTA